MRIIHGEKQKEYCEWKSNIFHSKLKFIEENGYSKKPAFRFTTKCFAMPYDIPIDKKKTCPDWILDTLDARGIAIWYMDDGNINKSKNRIRISTCSFDKETNEKFVKKFQSLGIICDICEDKGTDYLYYYLSFNSENSKKLMNLIRPYIHPNLDYKMDNLSDNPYIFSSQYLNYRHIIPDKIINDGTMDEVYDIEVEDNHNFIITSGTRGNSSSCSGVIVHNCQNMTEKELITLITRTGEFAKVFVIGDPEQSDINGKSGFIKMISRFEDDECRDNGIHVFRFGDEDIVRSALVRFISKRLKKVI